MAATGIPKIECIKGFDGVELDIDQYLTTDYVDVSQAAQELPAVMEWINELRQYYAEERELAEADLDYAKASAKADLEFAEATAYFDLRGTGDGNFAANYERKPTEEGIRMAIILDPAARKLKLSSNVRELKVKIATLSAMHSRLSGTIQSLQAKVELIRSSEATRRTTFDETTPSIGHR